MLITKNCKKVTSLPKNFITANIWDTLKKLDPDDVVRRSLAGYTSKNKGYQLRIIDKEYFVDLEKREVLESGLKEEKKAAWEIQLLAPIYLINAEKVMLKGQWVSPTELFGGDLFFAAPAHNLQFNNLTEKFSSPRGFLKAGLKLGGKKELIGDAAFQISVLPRIPILYIYRAGGGEFPNSITVFFDASAEKHLPIDSLWLAIECSTKRLLEGAR